MDRAQPGGNFLRCFAAIFLFARARNLRQHSGDLGCVFLQFRAAELLCRPFVHAGCAFAESRADWFVFFPALDATWRFALWAQPRKLSGLEKHRTKCPPKAFGAQATSLCSVFCWRRRDFIGAAYQVADYRHRCAAFVPGLAKMALEFLSATGDLAFCGNNNFTFGRVVLARASDCREILSASFLRRGRDPV